ncbi:hypothetical protein [Clostridium luticellarii]|jgi:Gpi18-like mannosyltransferase|uniref:Glycosyltransferase RgtA/B/C/D-like domain-containing protein n=1 Tax=Clostridium luticellarii TaxID=1691940 RepID=A0A2T0BSK1_9CLOT|nr:hypothetical protein [Clostridium luticellarii]MCI1945635.1 hypothetical protein [Clostridium luticellarii]MCI1968452.1 hypothetical protein [Clostridium luticellarii]MCI1996531.1 hypothetical protein [Clostridium luticellarii]MCI2039846.1 hypothetical protein [Clostridium luticellarii]PRR86843.1 hypothetical protein CLLU_00090 [Clostridium luticellarii]
MEKTFSKQSLFKIILIFLMALSLLLSIYSIKNYKSSSFPQNTTGQFRNFNGQNGQPGNRNGSIQKGQPGNASGSAKNRQSGNTNSGAQNHQFGNANGAAQNSQPGNTNGATQNRQPGNTNQPAGQNMQFGSSSKSKFAPLLTVYFAAFLIVCAYLYHIFIRKKRKINLKDIGFIIFSMLFIGFFSRIALSTLMEGYGGDIRLFQSWASSAANSLSQFYVNTKSSDYPPLYIYILALIGKASSIGFLQSHYVLLLKLPSIIADCTTAYFIFKLAQKHISPAAGIILGSFYIFNPAIFMDSALWGQVDSFFTLFIVISLFLLSEGKIVLSSVFFTCSVLMKPQGIIFLPVLFFEIIRKRNVKIFIKAAVSALATAIIVILPFSAGQNWLWIFKLYAGTISEYPYASVNGFNFFNLMGANYEKNTNIFFIFSYKIWGMAAITAITAFSLVIYMKFKNNKCAFSCALVQIAGVFTFSVGMHERYLFPAAALSILAFIYLKDKRLLILSAGYAVTIYGNIYYVLFRASGSMMNSNSHSLVGDGISLLNIILFFYLAKILVDITFKGKTVNCLKSQ